MTKKVVLQDTGERLIPEYHQTGTVWAAVYGEHLVRYEAARALVKGKVVLDIACGSGYGTALLAESAKKVIGVDVDETTVAYAAQNYGASNIEYLLGDAVAIPLADSSVDIVITYETIEHIADYKKFMSEIKRVLKPDGLAVISTPNDKEFIEGNHFHIHQFEYAELRSLIKQYFKHQQDYFQADWISTAIINEQQLSKGWSATQQVMNLAPKPIEKCTYFFMLCANRPITETVSPLLGVSEHWSYRDNRQMVDTLTNKATALEKEKNDLTLEIDILKQSQKATRDELSDIKGSRSWKLAQKMSRAYGLTRRPKRATTPKRK